MTDLKIGDKVKVKGLNKPDRTGVITAKSAVQAKGAKEVVIGKEYKEPETPLCWWDVKLDATGEIETCPDDLLERIK